MLKQLLLFVSVLLLFQDGAIAEGKIHVVVLPFDVHAAERLDYLSEQIRDLVERQLKDEGVVVEGSGKPLEGVPGIEEGGLNRLRTLGLRSGADFVIWGSFTQIGKGFSLDAKVMESYGDAPPETVYVEGRGLETLLDSVQRLASDLGMKVSGRERVAEVVITGNKRIESEAIKKIMKTKEGDVCLAKDLQDDLKSIYKMGYFSDVRVETSSTPKGKTVTFRVVENKTLRNIMVKGNNKFDDEKIQDIISVRSGSILNTNKLQGALHQIENFYKEEGYHHVKVIYEIRPVSENRADIDFVVEEGEKVFIKVICFEGNKAFDSETLTDLMETEEKGFFSWFTSSGDLDREVLDQDVSKIAAYYHNHGYILAKVAEPELTHEGEWTCINIKIDEGPQFRVGKVDIEGDLLQPKSELMEKMQIVQGVVYSREIIRQDILAFQDMYSDAGYAYADISPRIDRDHKELVANVTYLINKGPLVYFEKIIITGNTKTRDKVIRRELNVYEQELFSGKRLKRGTRNLYRLDFFEDIKINTTKGSSDDKMILKVDVKEKLTGALSFGGGYSSMDNIFVMGSISQRNLFGRGQILNLRAHLGGRSTYYTLSFTEPWLFDTPLSAGFDVYNTSMDYDTYDKDSVGGTIRFGYPVLDFTRFYLSYNYDVADIKNLTHDASSAIRDMEGENVANTLTGILRRDSRDRVFGTTVGSDNSITIKHAGTPFGGDIGYTKYVGDSGWYFPLFWNTVGMLHGRIGFINGDSVGKVPQWERFYLGGMGSVRGYEWHDISPRDPVTGDEIGGNKMLQFNVEFVFPIMPESGLQGVLFYDTGNAYDNGENLDIGQLRKSAGGGVRWNSPMGPISLEYGYILDDLQGKKGEGRWEFSMGSVF
ncbi:MAG: outer membrane protein assembly factor BamA [Desulfobacterales bacterium C00003060]|nr:MAG: outer membrane protein assembly factor BamA [Desulfobacterales bacterium C00003060]